MTAVSKVISLLAISVALTLSGSPVFAKSGGSPGQVKTSGTSATQSGNPAGGSVVRRPAGCGHKTYGACAFPTPQGATSGNDPRGPNRGPGNPTLHPK
jgi:hypothetical protein